MRLRSLDDRVCLAIVGVVDRLIGFGECNSESEDNESELSTSELLFVELSNLCET
ncbi:unnamed protein product [Schistosoma curassoni]|uniref:Uncharacterized protein n=1 Tax=Schistosoma curassoni TaxID=6186 RepID=A0A183KAT0_9TREM|nr:unnamed protein product [Schistosoma curassoni]